MEVNAIVQLTRSVILSTLCARAKRDKRAAKRCFCTALKATHTQVPRVINLDKNAAYPPAIEQLKVESTMAQACELRQKKSLNNTVEQDQVMPYRRVG